MAADAPVVQADVVAAVVAAALPPAKNKLRDPLNG